MRALLYLLWFWLAAYVVVLGACWVNTPPARTVVREVPTYRYIHDVPRECDGLPEFPEVKLLGDRTHFVSPYVAQLDAWIHAAGACLYVHTYSIGHLVQEVPLP